MGLFSFIKSLFLAKEAIPKTNCPIDISEYKSICYEAICPSCGDILDTFPVRSKKCIKCKSKIIRVKLPETDLFVLLNEVEGMKLKGDVDKYYSDKYQKTKMADQHYVENEEDYNSKLRIALSEKDFHNAKMLTLEYRNQLLTEVDYVTSENPEICNLVFNGFRYEILEHNKLLNIRAIKVYAGSNNCSKEHLNDKIFSVEKFIKEKPIPCIDCTAIPVYTCMISPCID